MSPQTQGGPSNVQALIGFFAILWQALPSRAHYLWDGIVGARSRGASAKNTPGPRARKFRNLIVRPETNQPVARATG